MKTFPIVLILLSLVWPATPALAADCTFVNKPEVRGTLNEFLNCEECTATRLKEVVAIDSLIPCFEEVLGAAEDDVDATYRAALVDAYRQMDAYYRSNPEMSISQVRMSEEEYVNGELANRMARLKARAVEALGAYGTGATKPILDSAAERLRGSSRTSDQMLFELIDQKR